jgi:hypothetical protein
MKLLGVIAALMVSLGASQAQELNCQITIAHDVDLDITTVEQEVFRKLEQTIF